MALPKIDVIGAPDYGALKGKEGIVFHTPENSDPSLEAAIATARWQATSGNSSGGSYHGILGYDTTLGKMSEAKAWVLVKTVPFGHIAGSISTRRDAIWAPERFPFLEQILSPAAYADPNAYLHALCLGGRAAWWSDKLGTDAGYAEVRGAIVRLAQWVRKLERLYDYDALLTLHRYWQTNRSDPGPLNFADLVMDEYTKLVAADEGKVADAGPTKAELQASLDDALADVTRLRHRVKTLTTRIDGKDKKFDAMAAEAAAGKAL